MHQFAYVDKRKVLQQKYSQSPILPPPQFRWVVNLYELHISECDFALGWLSCRQACIQTVECQADCQWGRQRMSSWFGPGIIRKKEKKSGRNHRLTLGLETFTDGTSLQVANEDI